MYQMTVFEVNYTDEISKCDKEILASGLPSPQRKGSAIFFLDPKTMGKSSVKKEPKANMILRNQKLILQFQTNVISEPRTGYLGD